ncbi:hypothetical protein [Isoptericola dokdonensis]|uniref:Uncharacterized protein n=1 Tax=Isoptericola dokdonensis DS-3 TaxID=1300344 RepID=A0A168EAP9_9MICO|nr:hypothetical protein [Isoptericola dokdonensis]ANC29812.1 hypothetical protein I598_0221 [Isoptericola dokdonensis DS-3]
MRDSVIPVVFDVIAHSEIDAAEAVATALESRPPEPAGEACDRYVEAWWLPVAAHKGVDRNDRPAMFLVEAAPTADELEAANHPGRGFPFGEHLNRERLTRKDLDDVTTLVAAYEHAFAATRHPAAADHFVVETGR